MRQNITLSEAAIYVGTYKKYNEGSLFGKWLKLSDYVDLKEFFEACRLLHSDEEDPEFMFQDYENIPEELIGECWICDTLFEVIEALQELDDVQDPFLVWCHYMSHNLANDDFENLKELFYEEYQGAFNDEEEFAKQLIEQCYDLTDFMKCYFDYKAFAKDLFCSDYWMEDGFTFRIT